VPSVESIRHVRPSHVAPLNAHGSSIAGGDEEQQLILGFTEDGYGQDRGATNDA
jgi:hypothetical protein